MKIRLYCLFAMLFVGGCASPRGVGLGPPFEPMAALPADKATVYIYRPARTFGSGSYPEIFLNGEKKMALLENGYGVFILPKGEFEIKVEGDINWWPPVAARKLSVEAGRDYYVRVVPILPPGVKPGPHLFTNNVSRAEITLIPKNDALRDISQTQLVVQQ
jgi:hypothetical protein